MGVFPLGGGLLAWHKALLLGREAAQRRRGRGDLWRGGRARLRVGGGGGHDRRGVFVLGVGVTTGVGLAVGDDCAIKGYPSRGGTRAMTVRSTSDERGAIRGWPFFVGASGAGVKACFVGSAVGAEASAGRRDGQPDAWARLPDSRA